MRLCALGLHGFLWFVLGLAIAPANAAEGSLDLIFKESEADGAKDGPKARLYSASKALVIGMDNYAGQGWPKLSMGIKDAEAVAEALKAQGFAVTLAKDLKSDDLDRTFRSFFINEGTDPESRLLIWFAGHGHTIAGEGYLVPVDGPDPRRFDTEFRAKALSLRRFGEYMREARAKHVLAVFDSCFAGTVFNVARSAPPRAITLSTALPVRQFVSSGDADQVVSDNGAFRRLFIDALEGREPDADANRDGYITGSELGLFLFDKVTNYSEKGQTPRYGKLNAQGYDRGDFVLERRKLDTPAIPTATVAPAAAPGTTNEAERAWGLVQNSEDASVLEAYRRQYGAGNALYDQLAASRIAALSSAAKAKSKVEEELAAAGVAKPPAAPKSPGSQLVQFIIPSSPVYKPGDTVKIKISAASRYVKAFAVFPFGATQKRKVEAEYAISEGGLYIPFKLPAAVDPGVYEIRVYVQEIKTKAEETHMIEIEIPK